MTLKQFIKNIRDPQNWVYAIEGKIKKMFTINKETMDKAMYYTYSHPTCYENGHCEKCGCDFDALILTNKTCEYVENHREPTRNESKEH